ncbi:MAG: hypothetical protein AAB933_00955 [Patescibacteria group bacterium]
MNNMNQPPGESSVPNERKEKKVYSPEINEKIKNALLNLRLKCFKRSLEDSTKLEEEIGIFRNRLIEKYGRPTVETYAMWHFFGGSTISPDREKKILYDDFPGDDSVTKFVEDLEKRYP